MGSKDFLCLGAVFMSSICLLLEKYVIYGYHMIKWYLSSVWKWELQCQFIFYLTKMFFNKQVCVFVNLKELKRWVNCQEMPIR